MSPRYGKDEDVLRTPQVAGDAAGPEQGGDMNLRLFPIDDPSHREAVELLPWFLNGTLDGPERTRVEGHLAECIACKQEAEDLRHLRAMTQREDPDAVVTR